ncbi:MAG: helix-turn-helix transcriptional regulator [Myxococcales bacterium]|nr:helix-turn-helix transcriptional regulator [Myxococcales bacterium]
MSIIDIDAVQAAALRFGHDSNPDEPLLRPYFQTLLGLAIKWSERGLLPYRLPTPQSADLRRATDLIQRQLGQPLSVPALARAAAMPERTLHRRFQPGFFRLCV